METGARIKDMIEKTKSAAALVDLGLQERIGQLGGYDGRTEDVEKIISMVEA